MPGWTAACWEGSAKDCLHSTAPGQMQMEGQSLRREPRALARSLMQRGLARTLGTRAHSHSGKEALSCRKGCED